MAAPISNKAAVFNAIGGLVLGVGVAGIGMRVIDHRGKSSQWDTARNPTRGPCSDTNLDTTKGRVECLHRICDIPVNRPRWPLFLWTSFITITIAVVAIIGMIMIVDGGRTPALRNSLLITVAPAIMFGGAVAFITNFPASSFNDFHGGKMDTQCACNRLVDEVSHAAALPPT